MTLRLLGRPLSCPSTFTPRDVAIDPKEVAAVEASFKSVKIDTGQPELVETLVVRLKQHGVWYEMEDTPENRAIVGWPAKKGAW